MRVIRDWRRVLRRAWSIRLMILAGVLSGIEAALPLLDGLLPIPTGLFAALSAVATAGAFITRILAQKEFDDETT